MDTKARTRIESDRGVGMLETKSGSGPIGRRRLIVAAGAVLGGLALAMAFQSIQPVPPAPALGRLASTPAEACRPPATAEKGGSTLTFGWQLAVETDRPDSSVLLFVSGTNTMLCQVGRMADGRIGAVSSGLGGHPGDTRVALTFDAGAGSSTDGPTILAGRVPAGTAAVSIVLGDGSAWAAVVRDGNYLAWLDAAATPVRIEARDANGRLLQQLAYPTDVAPS